MAVKLSKAESRKKFVKNIRYLGEKFTPPVHILGIDPSRSRCGWAFHGDNILFGTVKPPRDVSTFTKAVYVAGEIGTVIDDCKPHFVFMEDYSRGSKQGREEAGEIQGLIMHQLWIKELPLIKPSPMQIKKFIGADEKSHIMMEVLDKYKLKPLNDDEADAIVQVMMGRAMFEVVNHLRRKIMPINPKLEDYFFKACKESAGLIRKQATIIYKLIIQKGGDIIL